MPRHLFALVLIGLTLSPFTAPFQTVTGRLDVAVAPLDNEDHPGSLIGPLVTQAGRLTIVPPTGVTISLVPPVAHLTPVLILASRVSHDLTRPTVLRL
jgi:hypothetical protein